MSTANFGNIIFRLRDACEPDLVQNFEYRIDNVKQRVKNIK